NVSLSAIANAFDRDMNSVQWVLHAYIICVCSLSTMFGKLGDRLGCGKLFKVGLGIFGGSSFWISRCHSFGGLVTARCGMEGVVSLSPSTSPPISLII
ncbi:hypothetical protein KIPB_016729, partial [Kipferlia bialata]